MGRGANDCILQFLGDPDWRLELNKITQHRSNQQVHEV